jgi:hypothetical protein
VYQIGAASGFSPRHTRYRGGVHSNLWYFFGQLRAQVGRDIWFAVIIISCFVSKPIYIYAHQREISFLAHINILNRI